MTKTTTAEVATGERPHGRRVVSTHANDVEQRAGCVRGRENPPKRTHQDTPQTDGKPWDNQGSRGRA